MRKEDKTAGKETGGLTFESLDQSLCCVYMDAEGRTEFAAERAFYKCCGLVIWLVFLFLARE
jgi:hypothetical protein